MAILTYETRVDAATRLRAAADQMEAGDVKGAGVTLLLGLSGVAAEIKAAYGPLARIVVEQKVRDLFR